MVVTSQIQSHLTLLRICADTCRTTLFNHCLKMGGEHTEPAHVQRMMDCIEICVTAIDFITRHSEHHHLVCDVCATMCSDCADSCEAIPDEMMLRCADICRQCAFACKQMSHPARRVA